MHKLGNSEMCLVEDKVSTNTDMTEKRNKGGEKCIVSKVTAIKLASDTKNSHFAVIGLTYHFNW